MTTNATVASQQTVINVVSGWPLFLGSMRQEVQPSSFGGPATNSNADLFSWAGNATARINQIYSLMVGTDLWT